MHSNPYALSLNLFQSFIFHDLHHEMVLCVAFSHDGEEVVAGGMSGHVKVGPVALNYFKAACVEVHFAADFQPPRALTTPPNRRPQGTRQRLQILRGWEVRLKEGGFIEQPEFAFNIALQLIRVHLTPMLFLQRKPF